MPTINLHTEITEKTLGDFRAGLKTPGASVFVDIDSPGGCLSTAWKVYDLIREYDGEVKVNISGDCMSAATVILAAAKPENRTASAHARFLVHKPLIGFYVGPLTSDVVKDVDRNIEAEASKLCRLYMDRTNAPESCLRVLMNKEQIFSAELAQNLGFIATINHYNNKKSMTAKELLAKIKDILTLSALQIETADGGTLEINGEELVVGAETSNEDGVYLLPDGRRVLVEAGKVSEIQDPTTETEPTEAEDPEKKKECEAEGGEEAPKKEEEDPEEEKKELEALRAEVEALKAQLAEKEQALADNAEALEEAGKAVEQLKALKAVKSQAPKVTNQAPKNEGGYTSYEEIAAL